jgi:hypothetical protein
VRTGAVWRTHDACNPLTPANRQWLDWCPAHELYHRVLHLLTRLARKTEQLPRSISIRAINLDGERDPFDTSGGFSDVFRGIYLEKTVVIKRLRINVNADRDSNIYRVRAS